jgi:hypothetical protein
MANSVKTHSKKQGTLLKLKKQRGVTDVQVHGQNMLAVNHVSTL